MRPPVSYAQRTRPFSSVYREETPVVRAEVDDAVHDHGRRLDLAAGAHLPHDAALLTVERGDRPALGGDDDVRPVDRGRGRKRAAHAPAPVHLPGRRLDRVGRALERVHVEVALAVGRRELDVAPEPARPLRLLRGRPRDASSARASAADRRRTCASSACRPPARAEAAAWACGGFCGAETVTSVELGVERAARRVLREADREQRGAEPDHEHGRPQRGSI